MKGHGNNGEAMNCSADRVQDYLLGALPADEASDLERHLQSCARCAREAEQYASLFGAIRDLPLPAIPPGIAEAVIARLRPEPESVWARALRFAARVARTPDFAAGAGIAVGLLLALYPPPVLRIVAGPAGRILADIATGASAAIKGVVGDFLVLTGILEHLARLLVVLKALVRIPGDALMTLPSQVSLMSVALTLLMALCLGWLVGQVRREKLSHAKH